MSMVMTPRNQTTDKEVPSSSESRLSNQRSYKDSESSNQNRAVMNSFIRRNSSKEDKDYDDNEEEEEVDEEIASLVPESPILYPLAKHSSAVSTTVSTSTSSASNASVRGTTHSNVTKIHAFQSPNPIMHSYPSNSSHHHHHHSTPMMRRTPGPTQRMYRLNPHHPTHSHPTNPHISKTIRKGSQRSQPRTDPSNQMSMSFGFSPLAQRDTSASLSSSNVVYESLSKENRASASASVTTTPIRYVTSSPSGGNHYKNSSHQRDPQSHSHQSHHPTVVPVTPNLRPPTGSTNSLTTHRDRKLYTPTGNMLIKNPNLGLRSSLSGALTPSTALMVSNIDNILNEPDDDYEKVKNDHGDGKISNKNNNNTPRSDVIQEVPSTTSDSISSATAIEEWNDKRTNHENVKMISDDPELFHPKKMVTSQNTPFQSFRRIESDLSNGTNTSTLSPGSKQSDAGGGGKEVGDAVPNFVRSGTSFHVPKTRNNPLHHHQQEQQQQQQYIPKHEKQRHYAMYQQSNTMILPQYDSRGIYDPHRANMTAYNYPIDPSFAHTSIPSMPPQSFPHMGYQYHSQPYDQQYLPHTHADPSNTYDSNIPPHLAGHISPMFGGSSPINLPMMTYVASPIPFEQSIPTDSWIDDGYGNSQSNPQHWENGMLLSRGWHNDHYNHVQYDQTDYHSRSQNQSPHFYPQYEHHLDQSHTHHQRNRNDNPNHKLHVKSSSQTKMHLHSASTSLSSSSHERNKNETNEVQVMRKKNQGSSESKTKGKEVDLPLTSESRQSCTNTKDDSEVRQKQVNLDRVELYKDIAALTRSGEKNPTSYATEVIADNLSDDEKQSQLNESPTIRAIFKEFYRKFRIQEKESLEMAAAFAKCYLKDKEFPRSVHWRIYLELADLAKRRNNFTEARELYQRVCDLQPYASQGWLERSKLEEECGHLHECSQILKQGLVFCPQNENMRIRAIKHEEKMAYEFRNGDLTEARKLILPLEHHSIDKVWKIELEAALMEARAGNEDIARRFLKYLMKCISWYGPLYLEAFRLERDFEHPIEALAIVERGLQEIPRYGPLWFGAFRICEYFDVSNNDFHLPKTINMIEKSLRSISMELIWKVQMEAAQAIERSAHQAVSHDSSIDLDSRLEDARTRFARAIFSCPDNLCWKVWLAAGRMELSAGRFDQARKLFLKSLSVVPSKGRSSVLLECVRLEEFIGNDEVARALVLIAKIDSKLDWKVWLHYVNLEQRCGNRFLAIQLAQQGLIEHSGTGRLWATLIQLHEPDGESFQIRSLKKALHAVPKSGEVWCEAARIHMNPFAPSFDMPLANLFLQFATKFTPQYGDSFIETLRHDVLATVLELCLPSTMRIFLRKYNDYVKETPDMDISDIIKKMVEIIYEVTLDYQSNNKQNKKLITHAISKLDTSDLELRCSNADPNYGKLWFHNRLRPSDTSRSVLKRAKQIIWSDLERFTYVYIAAILRQEAVSIISHTFADARGGSNMPLLTDLLRFDHGDSVFSGASSADFATGLVEVNHDVDIHSLDLFERRKLLFGSDLLLTWRPIS